MIQQKGRRVVVGAALLTLCLVGGCATPGASTGKSSPIKVAFEVPLSGNFAANGKYQKNGFNLGLKQFGSKVNGHKIQVTYADTHGDPATALTTARKLVQDGATVFEGPLVASEAAAVTPFLAQRGIPVDDLTLCSEIQRDNWAEHKNGFSSGWSCDQPAQTAARWAYEEMGWRHMTIATQDFSFGWEVAGGFAAAFEKFGGTIDKFIYVPLNATDLSSYISQIPSGSQAVYSEMSGGFAVKFTAAYKSFGLKGKIPLLGITQLTDQSVLPNEDQDAVIGDVYTGAQYCDGIDTPENSKFVEQYKAAYGVYPGYYSEAGYVKAQILVSALKSLKGDVSDAKAVSKALKEAKVTAPRGPLKISDETFSPIQNNYICQVKMVDGAPRNVPLKTYENVTAQGPLGFAEWDKRFRHDSKARPG